jgi:hypothetical protein
MEWIIGDENIIKLMLQVEWIKFKFSVVVVGIFLVGYLLYHFFVWYRERRMK